MNPLLDIGDESIIIAELDLLPAKTDSGNSQEFRYTWPCRDLIYTRPTVRAIWLHIEDTPRCIVPEVRDVSDEFVN